MTHTDPLAYVDGHFDADGCIQPRGSVQWFSWYMEAKLRKNDYKGGWQEMKRIDLFALMQDEMTELLHALIEGNPDHIIDEAADVANIAHMLADNAERGRERG